MHPKLLATQLVVLLGIASTHWFALEHFLYWHWWWLDILMHTSGGLWIALASVWASLRINMRPAFFTIIVLALLIGTAWEVFEYMNGIAAPPSVYLIDTIGDMFAVLLGAIVGYFATRTFFHRV